MSVWEQYNKKTYVDFIANKYRHLYPMPEKRFSQVFKWLLIDSIK